MILKRMNAPKIWDISRKNKKFIVGTQPGPHSLQESLSLGVVLRDMMGYAENMREVKEILNSGMIKVNNRIRKSRNFPVGLMDIVRIKDMYYRVLPNQKGFYLKKIREHESESTLRKIVNKHVVKNGKVQLNFHDGTNMLVEKTEYKTGDVLICANSGKEIKDVIKFEKGNLALVTKGKNRGTVITLDKIIVTKSPKPNLVVLTTANETKLLPQDYVFMVGTEKPVIGIGEDV